MTTEPHPVVPGQEDLRDRIAQTVLDVTEIEHEYDDFGPVDHIANEVDIADAILETIEAAGLSIVATPAAGKYVAVDRDVWMEILEFLPEDMLESIADRVTPFPAIDPLAGGDR